MPNGNGFVRVDPLNKLFQYNSIYYIINLLTCCHYPSAVQYSLMKSFLTALTSETNFKNTAVQAKRQDSAVVLLKVVLIHVKQCKTIHTAIEEVRQYT